MLGQAAAARRRGPAATWAVVAGVAPAKAARPTTRAARRCCGAADAVDQAVTR
ncbi:hypothetical protein ACRAWF_16915 [Streptomyces sp. L7]